jgi:hypothetical protein
MSSWMCQWSCVKWIRDKLLLLWSCTFYINSHQSTHCLHVLLIFVVFVGMIYFLTSLAAFTDPSDIDVCAVCHWLSVAMAKCRLITNIEDHHFGDGLIYLRHLIWRTSKNIVKILVQHQIRVPGPLLFFQFDDIAFVIRCILMIISIALRMLKVYSTYV